MKMIIKFLENSILIRDSNVFCLEIENKDYFYRIVYNLNEIINNNDISEITFFDENNNEISMCNRIKLLIDYFNMDLASKKIMNSLNGIINNSMNEKDVIKINNYCNSIMKIIEKNCKDINLPIIFNNNYSINDILKNSMISINKDNSIFSNLLLLIDELKVLNENKLLIFINLKQYLCNEELTELYKYSLYNSIKILLIDSQSYGIKLEYEDKLIIDRDLEEYMSCN